MLRGLLKRRAETKRLEALLGVVNRVSGGVYKRIDENRELLAVLQRDCPAFLAKHWWVEGWLARQDDFLTALAEASSIPPHWHPGYPRPWPGCADLIARGRDDRA